MNCNPNDIVRKSVKIRMMTCACDIIDSRESLDLIYYFNIFRKHLLRNGDDILSGLAYAMGELATDEYAGIAFEKIFGTDFCDFLCEWDADEQYDEDGKAIRDIKQIKPIKEEWQWIVRKHGLKMK